MAALRRTVSRKLAVPQDQAVFPEAALPPAAAATRLVAGFAGFGAGTVNLALSSSFFAAAAGATGPELLAFGALAGLWGTALLAGSVVFLARDRLPGGGAARYVLAAAAAAHLAAIAFAAPGRPGLYLTQLSALLLTLMIIASLGWLRRAGARQESERQQPGQGPAAASTGARPGRLLLGAFAGAVLVAGITTPGLAASTAGQYAVPHGGHGNVAPDGHHRH
ncbi:hypothetical protein ACFFGR_11520 [Arthrobacter liuii]|uniref:hypothetical protein n=1 Tax=Arthrobacter liuii TaxID=1476996 RepID=UPI001E473A2B|nr:hypothetical protein [Arthrobacter liuii]